MLQPMDLEDQTEIRRNSQTMHYLEEIDFFWPEEVRILYIAGAAESDEGSQEMCRAIVVPESSGAKTPPSYNGLSAVQNFSPFKRPVQTPASTRASESGFSV